MQATSNLIEIPKHIQGIDWKLLKKQKAALINSDIKELEGLINMIDAIQDDAIKIYGMNEDIVYPIDIYTH